VKSPDSRDKSKGIPMIGLGTGGPS